MESAQEEEWPNATREDSDTLREAITLKFSVTHYPEDGRIDTNLMEVDDPWSELPPRTISNTLDVFLRERFDVSVDDFTLLATPSDFQPRVTEHNHTTGEDNDTEWNLADGYRLVQPESPAVGDDLTVDYQPDDEPSDRIEGTVTDATPRYNEDGDRYWELELEVGHGGTVEVSTAEKGTPVIHEHADGDRRTLGSLIGVEQAYKSTIPEN